MSERLRSKFIAIAPKKDDACGTSQRVNEFLRLATTAPAKGTSSDCLTELFDVAR